MRRTLIKILFIRSIVILAGITMLFSCENEMSEISKITQLKVDTDNHIKGLDLIYTDSGIVKLRMKAALAIIHEDEDDPFREFPEGIEVFFYKDRDTIVESYLIADYAINYTKKELTEVRGNVVVITDGGDTINTEKLYWDTKKKLVYSEELVRITQKEQVIIGENGFEANEDFSYYRILNSSGDLSLDEE